MLERKDYMSSEEQDYMGKQMDEMISSLKNPQRKHKKENEVYRMKLREEAKSSDDE